MTVIRQIKDLEKKVKRLHRKVCCLEETGGGGSGSGYDYIVNNYNELTATATNPQVNEFAYVINSQGTAWLPWNLGGTYYPSGTYFYTGSAWINDKSKIAEQLQTNIGDINQLETDLSNHINDLSNPHQTPTGGALYENFVTDDNTSFYYRGYNIISNGDWEIERFPDSDLNTVLVADETGNPSYTTLNDAWTNRLTLTYS